ncbi:hypothetical protein [Ruegeria lacuscaerulensis]|uniref:hypothetical protein n=1 Tax=Ruegeria lacuscaerulensis TaxID=55218 RepID=UPI00147B5842|nr:hypothetical protein [Ruegeria lacuscaerulensis]
MALDKTVVKDLKGHIAAARKRDLNFAICLGKKSDTTVFLLDRIKAPDLLGRNAKKAGETPKVAFGTCNADGNTLNLTLLSDELGGLSKKTRAFLTLAKLPMKVCILDAQGNLIEQDGEDADAEGDTAETQAPDPLQAKWEQLKSTVEPKILQFLKTSTGDVSKIRAAWTYAVRIGDEETDYAGAIKVAKRVIQSMTAADQQPEEAPAPIDLNEKKWQIGSAKFEPVLKKAIDAGRIDGGKANAAWVKAVAEADARNFEMALKILKALSGQIQAGSTAEPETRQTDALAGKQKYEQERARIAPILAAALKRDAAQFAKPKKIYAQAVTRAEAGEYPIALKALAMIEQELASADATPAGLDPGPTGREAAKRVRDIWDAACTQANGQIESLRKELAGFSDPNCQILADNGLTGFSENLYTRLNAAFLGLDAANEDKLPNAKAEAQSIFDEMGQFLNTNEAIQIMDGNDLSVSMTLAETLGGAVEQMKQALSTS